MKLRDKLTLLNVDCMEYMASVPDKYFDLAVVDPPYGIGMDGVKKSTSSHGGRKEHKFKGWDKETPTKEYFIELNRISINQIIWGANYFTQHLNPSMGWIFWDKGQRICNSDGELAFTSFNKALRVYELNRVQLQIEGTTFHPTQKPIKLYDWIYANYATENCKVIDTHLGSGSNAVAAHYSSLVSEFVGCELDKEYYDAMIKRVRKDTEQLKLF